jgi:hypothetical protein
VLLGKRQETAPVLEAGQIVQQRERLQRLLQAMALDGKTQRAYERCAVEFFFGKEILRALL